MTPSSLVDKYQYFRGTYCHHVPSTLVTQAEGPPETSVYIYQTARCHISDDLYSQPPPHPVSMQNLTISPFIVKNTVNGAKATSISLPVIGWAYLNSVGHARGATNWPVCDGRKSTGGGRQKKGETTLVTRMLNLQNSS